MQMIKHIQDRLNKKLTQKEMSYLTTWINKYNYSYEMIDLALHYSTNKQEPNLDYIHCLLSDWYHRGFTAKEDVLQWLKSLKKKYNR